MNSTRASPNGLGRTVDLMIVPIEQEGGGCVIDPCSESELSTIVSGPFVKNSYV